VSSRAPAGEGSGSEPCAIACHLVWHSWFMIGGMKIGMLGLGFMGSTHLQMWSRMPNAEILAVLDSDETRLSGDLSSIQGNLGGPGRKMDFSAVRKYRTIDEILADPDIEAVDICLPTFLHASVAIRALRAGKHVLAEKPMALNGNDADAMVAEAERAGRILMGAQVLRFFPEYRELSRLVKSGGLGTIRSAFFRRRTAAPSWCQWMMDKEKSGGAIFDLLIHDVDMSQLLFGVPVAVSSTGFEDMAGGIDVIVSEFHYPAVGQVTIAGGWFHRGEYPFSMEFTVVGDRGVVEYGSAGRPMTVYWADGRREQAGLPAKDGYEAELEYFLACCTNGSPPVQCPPAESASAVKLTNLMVDAREKKGEKVKCPF
jgi:predicted dehydrogenase